MAELNAITNNPNYKQPTTNEGPPYGTLFVQLYPSSHFRLWAREGGPLVDEFVRFCFAYVLKMRVSDLVSHIIHFSIPSSRRLSVEGILCEEVDEQTNVES